MMEPNEARLLLEGVGGRFVIGAGFWNEIVEWAMEQGWLSERPGQFNRSTETYEVSAKDAARLAEALDIIGGSLVLKSNSNVSDDFVSELSDALLILQRFAESGGFRILPVKG